MIRRILGVILGTVGAILTLTLVERLSSRWLPPASGQEDVESMLAVILAWFMGGLIGTWLATLMEPERRKGPAIWVAAILLGLTVAYLLNRQHPLWFEILGILIYLPATWLGIRSARPSPRR